MKKLNKKNVTKGMVFRVTGLNERDIQLGLGLGTLKQEYRTTVLGTMMNPSVGSLVRITKPPYRSNTTMVEWEKVNPATEASEGIWESYWSEFKNHTDYVSGEIKPGVQQKLTSPEGVGKFRGFEVNVTQYDMNDYMGIIGNPYVGISMLIEFEGDFQGASKLTTKLINQIKRSPGFAEHVLNLIYQELDAHGEDYKPYYPQVNNEVPGIELLTGSLYEAGKIRITTRLGNSMDETKEQFKDLIVDFINSNSSRVQIECERVQG